MTEAPRKKLTNTLQENLITTLAYHEEGGRRVLNQVDPTHFEAEYRTVAERVVGYWQKYDRPPQDHTPDLFADIIEDPHNRRASTYKHILSNMVILAPSLHIEFVADEIAKFNVMQKTKSGILRAAQLIDSQKEQALPAIREILAGLADGTADPSASRWTPVTEFEAKDVDWYWKPFFPNGMASILAAWKGYGKTTVLIDIAADLSTRKKPRATFYLTKENTPAELRGLMERAKGDPRLLFIRSGVEAQTNRHHHAPPEVLTSAEMRRLDQEVKEQNQTGTPVGLIVIEPFASFVPMTKINQDAGVREVFDKLSLLADKYDLMVIVSVHLNKNRDAPLREKVMNSAGIVNSTRSTNVILKDPEEPGRNVLIAHLGNFLSPDEPNAVGFEIVAAGALRRIEWEDDEPTDHISEEAANAIAKSAGFGSNRGFTRPSKLEGAIDWLKERLADGPVPRNELKQLGNTAGYGWRTVQTAKGQIGAKSVQRSRQWWWELPEDDD